MEYWNYLGSEEESCMIYALIGIIFLGLTIFFHEKRCERMKAVCYYIAIAFLAIGAISVWVGDFRDVFGH